MKISVSDLRETCEVYEIEAGEGFMQGSTAFIKIYNSKLINSESVDFAISLSTWGLKEFYHDELVQRVEMDITIR